MSNEYGFDLLDEEALAEEYYQQSFVETILLNNEEHKSTECILLSMFDQDDRTNVARARNKACAQNARDADKLFIQLMQAELKEMLETFELYATYTANLAMHVSHEKEGMHMFEKRFVAHKAKIELLVIDGDDRAKHNPDGGSIRERNRQHAQKSRRKKNQYINDLTTERDESFVTLEQIVKYTTALESSCSFLDSLNEYVGPYLMELRQKLFDRTCAHQDKYPQMKSYLIFRGTHRANFK